MKKASNSHMQLLISVTQEISQVCDEVNKNVKQRTTLNVRMKIYHKCIQWWAKVPKKQKKNRLGVKITQQLEGQDCSEMYAVFNKTANKERYNDNMFSQICNN